MEKKQKGLIQDFIREKEGEINDIEIFFDWVDSEGKEFKVEDSLLWLKGLLVRMVKKKERWEKKLNK